MNKLPRGAAEAAAALIAEHKTLRAAAAAAGLSYGAMHKRYTMAVELGLMTPLVPTAQQSREKAARTQIGKREPGPEVIVRGRVRAPEPREKALPKKGGVKRYVLTCAQNNTPLFDAAWASLLTLANYYDAEIMVSRFTYDKATNGRSAKVGSRDASDTDDLWYDPRIAPFIADERVRLAPGLVWCGELNILPTAVRPLSGLETYTGRDSSVIPHVKLAMESVASGKYEATKFVYTTGTVTQRNYIQKKAGQKAEFHHCYGALLVEVDSSGSWWCRQLNADSEGVIFDLYTKFDGVDATEGYPVEAISWGDIHVGQMDEANEDACWGPGGMLDKLRPSFQFLHDVLDFRARNHHERGNPHKAFERHVKGDGDVRAEVEKVREFIVNVSGPGMHTVIVDSNHDNAMTRWLREADYRTDPLNAVYFLQCQLAMYQAIRGGDRRFHLLEWALDMGGRPGVYFLRQDESFVICRDRNGGIECGMHGHLGPNGRRGSANAFARMGRKAIVGHAHTAGIVDGIYTAGTSSNLDLGYNAGPSSWSHSHVITFPNGKRQILTVWKGKWRAA